MSWITTVAMIILFFFIGKAMWGKITEAIEKIKERRQNK